MLFVSFREGYDSRVPGIHNLMQRGINDTAGYLTGGKGVWVARRARTTSMWVTKAETRRILIHCSYRTYSSTAVDTRNRAAARTNTDPTECFAGGVVPSGQIGHRQHSSGIFQTATPYVRLAAAVSYFISHNTRKGKQVSSYAQPWNSSSSSSSTTTITTTSVSIKLLTVTSLELLPQFWDKRRGSSVGYLASSKRAQYSIRNPAGQQQEHYVMPPSNVDVSVFCFTTNSVRARNTP